MAIKTIRIGSAERIHQYDDAEYSSGIEVDEVTFGTFPAATPVDGDLLVFRDVSNDDELSTCTFAQLKVYLGL